MSYCRFTEADVYVYMSDQGLECCGCWLRDPTLPKPVPQVTFTTTVGMLAHLDEHRGAGHDVPDFVYQGLLADEEQNDREMNS